MTLPAIASAPLVGAVLYTVLLWWFSTGAILWLDRLPRATYRWSLLAASALAVAGIVVLMATRDAATPFAAFAAFTAAIAVWGWHELSFLTGFVTGPSAAACPPGLRGWGRFRAAAATLMHHEVALAVTAVGLAALSWGHANAVGAATFTVLFGARLSSKLNLFLGAPNFTDAFFPAHLRHLTSYIRKGPVSALFPVSLLTLGALAAAAAWRALDPSASPFAATGGALVFALAALALLEHGFMALPLPDAALWRWALPASERARHPTPRPIAADTVKTPV